MSQFLVLFLRWLAPCLLANAANVRHGKTEKIFVPRVLLWDELKNARVFCIGFGRAARVFFTHFLTGTGSISHTGLFKRVFSHIF
jgi:hypothetical protein